MHVEGHNGRGVRSERNHRCIEPLLRILVVGARIAVDGDRGVNGTVAAVQIIEPRIVAGDKSGKRRNLPAADNAVDNSIGVGKIATSFTKGQFVSAGQVKAVMGLVAVLPTQDVVIFVKRVRKILQLLPDVNVRCHEIIAMAETFFAL